MRSRRRRSRAPRRSARRSRRRGAALIEALVVIFVLVACLAGLVCANEVFVHELDTVYDARRRAWEQTMAGCNQFPLDVAALARRAVLRDRHVIEGLMQGEFDFQRYLDDTMAYLLEFLGGEDVRIASAETDLNPPATFDEVPRTTGTSTLMGCNEEPHDLGTRSSLLEWIAGLFF